MAFTPTKKTRKTPNSMVVEAKPMNEAKRALTKLAQELFTEQEEREEFLEALDRGDCKDQALIVMQDRIEIKAFPRMRPLKWQPSYIERIEDTFKPSKHPLYAKGAYYSLDFSSVFSASAMLAMDRAPKRVLDLCASPGGKAVFAYRAFKPDVLLCNETMRNRTSTLINNLHRCKCETAAVWSSDTSVYGKKYKQVFDLVICDAPCSGQSLLAKGEDPGDCFTPKMIDMNVGRQRRITGNAYHCLRPGGYLLYATCTFTPKENEKVMDWLLKTYDDLEAVEVTHLIDFRSKFSDFPSYRIYPHQDLGAGAFVCLVRKKGEPDTEPISMPEMPTIWKYGQEVYKPRPAQTPPPPTEEEEAEKNKKVPITSARQIVKNMTANDPKRTGIVSKKPRKRRK